MSASKSKAIGYCSQSDREVATWVELAAIAVDNSGELVAKISPGTVSHALTFGGVEYRYGVVGASLLTKLDDLRLVSATILDGEYPKPRKIDVRY